MSKLEDDLKTPYVSHELVEYLDNVFDLDTMINKQTDSAECMIGVMRGVRLVVNHLRSLSEQREDDDN